MLRRHELQPIDWSTHTLSQLQQRKIEESKKRLAQFPKTGLYSCTDVEAEELWRASWYAEETPDNVIFGADELRSLVFNGLPAETALLSEEEHGLLEYLISGKDAKREQSMLNPVVVENLARRLWCTVQMDHHGKASVRIDPMLAIPLTVILMSPAHRSLRDKVEEVQIAIRNELDLCGSVTEEEALSVLWTEALRGTPADEGRYARRWLRTSFDYIAGDQNLIVHEGMGDPYSCRERLCGAENTIAALSDLDVMKLTAAAGQSLDMMTGALMGAVRPEISPEIFALDLQILACQGVSYEQMRKTMCNALLMSPSEKLLSALKLLKSSSPLWGKFQTGLVQ